MSMVNYYYYTAEWHALRYHEYLPTPPPISPQKMDVAALQGRANAPIAAISGGRGSALAPYPTGVLHRHGQLLHRHCLRQGGRGTVVRTVMCTVMFIYCYVYLVCVCATM